MPGADVTTGTPRRDAGVTAGVPGGDVTSTAARVDDDVGAR